MNDYIAKNEEKKRKRLLVSIIVILFVFVVLTLMYGLYEKIEVGKNEEKQNLTVQRTSQIIEEEKQKNINVTQMLEQMEECVVGISKVQNTGNTIFLKDGAEQLGLGTGIVVTDNGYILTNEHVSGEKYTTCYVTLETGKNYKGNVVWSNSDIDLAIVKINVKNLKYATLGDSDKVSIGESVYAIGNPIGFEFQRTVTSGIISAVNRTIRLTEEGEETYMEDLIQTDATINPGNSGGPLININGEIIGVNSVKITSAEGIGFAVPINTAKPVVESFRNKGEFEEATLGVFAYDKNVIPYLESNLKLERGIYITNVKINSAAYKAGLKKRDIILSIDGNELEKMCDLRCYIYTKVPGDKVYLKILRNNKEISIEAELKRK